VEQGAGVDEMVSLLREHPEEREAILAELHPRLGNSGVDAVLRAEATPAASLAPGGAAKGGSANATSPSGSEERARVEATVRFLQEAASHVELGGGANGKLKLLPEDRLLGLLAGWRDSFLVAEELLARTLKSDPSLTRSLRAAYSHAVDEAFQRSDLDLIQKNRGMILEWAWPIARPEVKANELIDALPQEQRARLRIENVRAREWTSRAISASRGAAG